MDDKWFKQQQKKSGVTADQIAARLNKDRSVVSKIYSGKQRMTLEWAQAFADVLAVSLDQVLEKAGVLPAERAVQVAPGFSEADVVPWRGAAGSGGQVQSVAAAFGARAGVDVWKVQTTSMQLAGLMPGDFMLVDTNRSELAKAGDTVVAQIYDWAAKTARTVLRRYEPPVLVACSMAPEDQRVHVVDGNNVVIKGLVVAAWRI